MPDINTLNQHYMLVEKAIAYLLEHHTEQPELSDIAAHVGLSEFYFQRLFVEWAGISPKRFLQFLTREYMKNLLDEGYSTLDAAYQAGLSGGGRCHELFVNRESITPAHSKTLGKDLKLSFGFHTSTFGDYLLACSDRGICQLNFVETSLAQTEYYFREDWALASIERNQQVTEVFHQKLFSSAARQEIKLLLRGTPFQIQVWQALLKIPFGAVANYEQLAASMGKTSATRAAASAIAKNKIAYLIPCHRVIRKIGDSGEFRWGKHRKKLLLACEGAASSN